MVYSLARVLVTGVTGQIGHYAATLLSQRGATVYGLIRQTTKDRSSAKLPYLPISGDLLDEYSLMSILEEVRPTHLFNFGAQSFIPASWTQPILTAQYTALGLVRLLEAIRRVVPSCRLLQAGSSELFARATTSPQDESFPISPRNPYGIAKAFAFHTVLAHREHYGLHATNAIFFTNESPRRSPEFLFRKVTKSVAEIVAKRRDKLVLGNLDTVRDWGFAPEYAEIAVDLLDLAHADDYVVATGEGRRIRDLVETAFSLVGLDWHSHVETDAAFARPSEPSPLIGNASKLRAALGRDVQVRFEHLVRYMLASDLTLEGLDVPFEIPAGRYAEFARP